MPMHTVAQGEHITSIAKKYGFSNYKTLWDDPRNADLKALRKNPNVLLPGDQVFIPDRVARQESRSTDQKAQFVLSVAPLKLRVKLLDLSNKPIDRSGKVQTQAGTQDVSPAGHIYDMDIDSTDADVQLTLGDPPDLRIHMAVGSLDPIDETTGQQERLNNLAYFAGFSSDPDPAQLQWAIEEFQCDHQDQGVKVDGQIDKSQPNGKKTQDVLLKEHGV